jgi:hypothetical protein
MPVATITCMRLDNSKPTGRFIKTELRERRHAARLVFEGLYGLPLSRTCFGHTLNFILTTFYEIPHSRAV